MSFTIGYIDPTAAKFEAVLSPEPNPVIVHDDAAEIMVLWGECLRGNPPMEEAYRRLMNELALRWKHPVSLQMTYLIMEACSQHTSQLKKTHIVERNLASSESPPQG